jgi:hypothetical protein
MARKTVGAIESGSVKIDPLAQLPTAWNGVAGRFGVHLFEGHLSLDDMDRLDAIGARWRGNDTMKIVELVIVYPSEARMSTAERQRMAQLIKRWEHYRVASATVILAPGLLGTIHRSVLSGLQMLAPAPHPVKVFRDTKDALAWLDPHVRAVNGEDATQALTQAAVDAFCAAFKARG